MKNTYSPSVATLRKLGLTALLAGGATLAAQAQLNYQPSGASTLVGTFTDLGSTGTVIATSSNDDANSAAQNIGFSFTFNGTSFTQFVLNTNGLIRLGDSPPSDVDMFAPFEAAQTTAGTDPISSTDPADVNLLMPFNFDLDSGTGGAEYRVYTTGNLGSRVCTIQWKNVKDKTATGPTQYAAFTFQLKLYEGTNQIDCVYSVPTGSTNTDGVRFATIGIKGSDSTNDILVNKTASANPWSTVAFITGQYASSAFNFRRLVTPEAGRTYRFTSAVANDAGVAGIYTLGKLPTTALPHVVQAVVRNVGTTDISNLPVTLTVTGANSFTNTQTVPSLAVGASATVSFAALPTSFVTGVNTLNVSIPADGSNGNNSQATQQTVNASGTFSYVPTDQATPTSSVGAPANTAGTSSAGAVFGSVFTTATAGTVASVRVYISDVNSVGRTVQGVVLSPAGAVIGSSANYVVTSADINAYHTFAITTPPSIASGGSFTAGLSQAAYTINATSPRNFPVAYQQEGGARTGTFLYYTSPTGGGTPTDLAGYRFLIEATVLNALATGTSQELLRAVTVYPNPSASGQFTLDVKGANASAGLGVEVTNQLGQRVYTGSARDNFANHLNLSSLAPGIYHLTLRNGSDYASTKLVIE